MHKMKRPCKCGHRAGKHAINRKKRLPFLDIILPKSNFMAKPYKSDKHDGFCYACKAEGRSCRAFKERDPIPVPAKKEVIA